MRLLLTGATGLVGSAVLCHAIDAGHQVVAVVRTRNAASRRLPATDFVHLDMSRATDAADWLAALDGVDTVVNAAGALQDGPRDSLEGVHVGGLAALVAACESAGVRRFVHVSALGVGAQAKTAFGHSKHRGDRLVMESGLDWVILRPSVILGRAAYGGSALFRGLAALPIMPVVADGGLLQPVQLDEVARTVVFFLAPGMPGRTVVDIAGPERMTVDQVVGDYRRWLGWPPARRMQVPAALARTAFLMGDAAGRLGWRAPLRSTALSEAMRGSTGDIAAWTALTGIAPRPLSTALASEPASVQERWFSRLFLLKPVLLATLSGFWIVTGLIALGPGHEAAADRLAAAGAAALAPLGILAGAAADIAIGLGIAVRRSARAALLVAIVLSVLYLLAGTLLAPSLWADPLGPLVKIVPIILAHLAALAVIDER